MSLYRVETQGNELRVLLNTARLKLNPSQLNNLGFAVRDLAARVQARAVRNVSGYPVQYDGKVFRVVVRTGTLKGAIDMQWPYQTVLWARVFVNGAHTSQVQAIGGYIPKPVPVRRYAAAIEFGHPPIDLKQFMRGKTVPFFASRTANTTGPFAARGLTPVDDTGEMWENKALNRKLTHPLWGRKGPMYFQRKAGKIEGYGGGAYYIAFRKVGKTGWVIPAAKPRPFMRAAGTSPASQRDARRLTSQRLRMLLEDAAKHR